MAALFRDKKPLFSTSPAEAAATIPVPAEQNVYFRFYNDKDEIFWKFLYRPSDYCLNTTCRMLKFPNYEEIDEIEFRKGYQH